MGLSPVSLLRLLVERLLPRGPRAALADGARCGVHAGPPARTAADSAWPRQGAACLHAHDVGMRPCRDVAAVRSVLGPRPPTGTSHGTHRASQAQLTFSAVELRRHDSECGGPTFANVDQ